MSTDHEELVADRVRFQVSGPDGKPITLATLYFTEIFAELYLPEFAGLFSGPGGQAGLRTNRHLDRLRARRKAAREIAEARRQGTPEALAKLNEAMAEFDHRSAYLHAHFATLHGGPTLVSPGGGQEHQLVGAWDDASASEGQKLTKFEAFDIATPVPGIGLVTFSHAYADRHFPKVDAKGKPVPSHAHAEAYDREISALLREQKLEQFARLDAALHEFFIRCGGPMEGNAPWPELATTRAMFVR